MLLNTNVLGILTLYVDHTWRAAVHGDHYVTGNFPGIVCR